MPRGVGRVDVVPVRVLLDVEKHMHTMNTRIVDVQLLGYVPNMSQCEVCSLRKPVYRGTIGMLARLCLRYLCTANSISVVNTCIGVSSSSSTGTECMGRNAHISRLGFNRLVLGEQTKTQNTAACGRRLPWHVHENCHA